MSELPSQTEWNGGTLTNIRIHTIREEIKMCVIDNNISGWITLLTQMNHELYGFESEEEQKEIRNSIKECNEEINRYKARCKASRYKALGIPREIINNLNEIQYTLDNIFHKSGLQTALKEDAGGSW
jgi:hypothetical protein